MADRALATTARRGLLLAGLAVAAWSVSRVVRLLAGDDSVVSAGDRHGYAAVFSLVLVPVLVVAVVALVAQLWRGRDGVAAGVALAVSAPLAGSLAVVALVLGVVLVVVAVFGRGSVRAG